MMAREKRWETWPGDLIRIMCSEVVLQVGEPQVTYGFKANKHHLELCLETKRQLVLQIRDRPSMPQVPHDVSSQVTTFGPNYSFWSLPSFLLGLLLCLGEKGWHAQMEPAMLCLSMERFACWSCLCPVTVKSKEQGQEWAFFLKLVS